MLRFLIAATTAADFENKKQSAFLSHVFEKEGIAVVQINFSLLNDAGVRWIFVVWMSWDKRERESERGKSENRAQEIQDEKLL